MALTQTSVGRRQHRVMLQNPSGDVPDGEGGYTQGWVDLAPAVWTVSIEVPSARDLERVAAGSVISQATRILRGLYRPDVTTKTRVLFNGRIFSVTAVNTVDERERWLELVCEELVA